MESHVTEEMDKITTRGKFSEMDTSLDPSSREGSSSPTPAQHPSSIDEKKLVRRIDLRLLPILFIIYVAAFLDRVNISNALTMSLPKDLNLKGVETNVALTIFFIPYILFEIPSNLLMKKFRPHVWLSGCIFSFGIIMLAQGFVKSYAGLLATRFFLGIAEAGMFPGSLYLLSMWYKREESQKRFTVYWCSTLTASAFGGLLASAIAHMNGLRGLHNWQWIFIIEGMVTILLGILAFFTLCDFPQDAKWLTEDEKAFVIARTHEDQEEDEKITLSAVGHYFLDVKNYLSGLMYFTCLVPLYSFAYFTPTIIKTYGYSIIQTQLHSVPPAAAALGLTFVVAYLSDRTRIRYPFIVFSTLLTISGFAILMTVHHNFHAEYAGICLTAMGIFSAGPVIICWYVMNLRGHIQRAIGTAFMIGFGNSGGIVATFTFQAKDAPYYRRGYSICLGAMCLCLASSTAYAALARAENKKLKSERESGQKNAVDYYL